MRSVFVSNGLSNSDPSAIGVFLSGLCGHTVFQENECGLEIDSKWLGLQ